MTRPRTSLLLWTDYAEAADAIEQMLRPAEFACGRRADAGAMSGGDALRVLLVDDSATVRAAFTKLMHRQGFEVETANSVAAGPARKALSMPLRHRDRRLLHARGEWHLR